MCNRRFGVHEFVSFAMGAMGVACSGQTLALTSSNANIGNGTDAVGSSGLGGGIASGAGAGSTSASGVTGGIDSGSQSAASDAGGSASGAIMGVGGSSGDAASDAAASTNDAGSGSAMSSGTSASGSGTSSGLPPTSVCYGAGTRVLTNNMADAFIDDFEEPTISPGWSSFSDVMPKQNAFQIMQVAGGAVGTAHSGHYAGTGARTISMGGVGVGIVYNTAIDPSAHTYCIDISAFDGVSFWAKAAKAGSTISLNFVLPQTNMVSMDGMGRPQGGDCTMNCYNHPYVSVTLTADWAQYAVKFSDAAGSTSRVGRVLQELAWLSPDSSWDFSLDEIAFYEGMPPTGPVGPSDLK
jgi:hypothetical protein